MMRPPCMGMSARRTAPMRETISISSKGGGLHFRTMPGSNIWSPSFLRCIPFSITERKISMLARLFRWVRRFRLISLRASIGSGQNFGKVIATRSEKLKHEACGSIRIPGGRSLMISSACMQQRWNASVLLNTIVIHLITLFNCALPWATGYVCLLPSTMVLPAAQACSFTLVSSFNTISRGAILLAESLPLQS